jgi:hypothetical protein
MSKEGGMFKKIRQTDHENLWNRLGRDLIYDAKQILLYCGIQIPENHAADYADFVTRITKGTEYGAIHDPFTHRIHFEPTYIQTIVDQAYRFDFPIVDNSFGPGGIAGFIHKCKGEDYDLTPPSLNNLLNQAMLVSRHDMPFSFVCARQLNQFEIEQFGVTANIFKGPMFFNVTTEGGVKEALAFRNKGYNVMTHHTIFESPLKFSSLNSIDIFRQCVEQEIPTMLATQPFSGQNGPMTPYGISLLAFAEFLAGMAVAYAINPETKIINGAYPTMCTPGISLQFKIGTVTHNFVNYLVAFTSRLLDIPSVQSGCTIEGHVHHRELLETDYETIRAIILWDSLFEGWHMIRHCYGLLDNLAAFSFEKAEDDIAALRHLQSLDDQGIKALLANNIRLNRDIQKADMIYQRPTLLFKREKDTLLEVMIETIDIFKGNFSKHAHTLENIPEEWF